MNAFPIENSRFEESTGCFESDLRAFRYSSARTFVITSVSLDDGVSLLMRTVYITGNPLRPINCRR